MPQVSDLACLADLLEKGGFAFLLASHRIKGKGHFKMITKESEEKTFKYETKSLDDFAVALALGAEVVSVDRKDDDRFFTFHLKASFDIEKMALQLASKTLTVNAYDLCEALRRAKSIVHNR